MTILSILAADDLYERYLQALLSSPYCVSWQGSSPDSHFMDINTTKGVFNVQLGRLDPRHIYSNGTVVHVVSRDTKNIDDSIRPAFGLHPSGVDTHVVILGSNPSTESTGRLHLDSLSSPHFGKTIFLSLARKHFKTEDVELKHREQSLSDKLFSLNERERQLVSALIDKTISSR